jgi:hypothetical protein
MIITLRMSVRFGILDSPVLAKITDAPAASKKSH